MSGNFVKLVEDHNLFLTQEVEKEDGLSLEEQQYMFKGWALGKASDDVDFLNNENSIIVDDFKDDIIKAYGEDAITLEDLEFIELVRDVKGKLTDEDDIQEPTEDEEDAPETEEDGELIDRGEAHAEAEKEDEEDLEDEEEI